MTSITKIDSEIDFDKIKKNDSEELSKFFLECRPYVIKRIEREGFGDAAEDIYIKSFTVFLENLHKLAGRINTGTFLNLVENVLMQEKKRERLNRPENIRDVLEESIHKSAESDNEELYDVLEECLNSMGDAEREMLVDYYAHEKQEKVKRRQALAKTLGITNYALRVRVHRLRGQLRSCMEAKLKRRGDY